MVAGGNGWPAAALPQPLGFLGPVASVPVNQSPPGCGVQGTCKGPLLTPRVLRGTRAAGDFVTHLVSSLVQWDLLGRGMSILPQNLPGLKLVASGPSLFSF